jgi:hypothetical protein
MIKNPKLRRFGTKKKDDKPGFYKDSALFPKTHPATSGSKYAKAVEIPDPALEPLEPEDDEKAPASDTNKAIEILKANFSSGKDIKKPEQQKIDAYSHGFAREIEGETGSITPDLPERGRDWHGTVPGVPDEPEATTEEEEKEQKEAQEYFKPPPNPLAPPKMSGTQKAMKALAGAPRFAQGPVMPPRAVDFLLEHGFTPDEIMMGEANMTPRMRALYNRNLQSNVYKSITALKGKVL